MAKTREEFNKAVLKRYLEFKENELKKTKADLFNDAYSIAKTESIASFLRDSEDEEIHYFGTMKKMLPVTLALSITWIIIILGWMLIGLPLGVGTSTSM